MKMYTRLRSQSASGRGYGANGFIQTIGNVGWPDWTGRFESSGQITGPGEEIDPNTGPKSGQGTAGLGRRGANEVVLDRNRKIQLRRLVLKEMLTKAGYTEAEASEVLNETGKSIQVNARHGFEPGQGTGGVDRRANEVLNRQIQLQNLKTKGKLIDLGFTEAAISHLLENVDGGNKAFITTETFLTQTHEVAAHKEKQHDWKCQIKDESLAWKENLIDRGFAGAQISEMLNEVEKFYEETLTHQVDAHKQKQVETPALGIESGADGDVADLKYKVDVRDKNDGMRNIARKNEPGRDASKHHKKGKKRRRDDSSDSDSIVKLKEDGSRKESSLSKKKVIRYDCSSSDSESEPESDSGSEYDHVKTYGSDRWYGSQKTSSRSIKNRRNKEPSKSRLLDSILNTYLGMSNFGKGTDVVEKYDDRHKRAETKQYKKRKNYKHEVIGRYGQETGPDLDEATKHYKDVERESYRKKKKEHEHQRIGHGREREEHGRRKYGRDRARYDEARFSGSIYM